MNFNTNNVSANVSAPSTGRVGAIAGVVPTSLVDFPGHVSVTFFLGGCNFRCPFCQNPDLVLGPWESVLDLEELPSWLAQRRRLMDAICVSGGEPCLNAEVLAEICHRAREQDMAVKLDTNGSLPEALARILSENLVQYVALDVKTAPQDYHRATRTLVDLQAIAESVSLVREAGVDHELRTTVIPRLHTPEKFQAIGEWLGGDSPYFLQPFRPGRTLDPDWRYDPRPSYELMDELAAAASQYFRSVAIRD